MTPVKSRSIYFVAQVVLLMLVAREAHAEPIPSLEGTWQSEFKMQTRQGISITKGTITVTQQDEHLFRGTFAWSVDAATRVRADVRRRVGRKGREEFLGLLAWDNKTINMVDAGDKGYWFGQLLDEKTMRLIYVESERHSAIFRATFIREKPKPAE